MLFKRAGDCPAQVRKENGVVYDGVVVKYEGDKNRQKRTASQHKAARTAHGF